MENINFNKLAWEAPKHGEKCGYIPTDKYYNDIVKWLKTGTRRYRSTAKNITTTRIAFENSDYDVIVEFDHKDKMISWTFRHQYEYQV